jgi:recombination protein RecA
MPAEKTAASAAMNGAHASEREKALETTMSQIERKFGKGAIMRLGEARANTHISAVSTGSVALDIALGIGGIPRGRITEIYGPESSGKTTLCQHVIANVQATGGTAAYIDAEHALDPTYAERCGVDVANLLISQPDTGEQALEIAEMLVRSGAVELVVIDSVAALVPRAEIEGEMGDSHVGLQARLMSQALRKLTGTINSTKTAVMFTNQLRDKIGVMFGCFHYDARITLADGTTEKIGKIVNQKLPVEVLSYNEETGAIEPRKVINWFDNGRTEHFLQFIVAHNESDGRSTFACTPNHKLLTDTGWKEASEIREDESLISGVMHYLTPLHWDVIRGSLLGDGAFRRIKAFNTQFRVGHGAAQDAYCLWKESLFEGVISYSATNSKGGHSFDTIPMYELTAFRDTNYSGTGKDPSIETINSLNPLSLAIWYLDDGTFDKERENRCSICCPGIPLEKQQMLVAKLEEMGLHTTLTARGLINFSIEATRIFHAMIAPYVHPSMAYKLLPEFRGKFQPLDIKVRPYRKAVAMPIVKIYEKPMEGDKSTHRFDIEIEGTHTYLVDNVVVHNSPETTTGGKALKFYASVRLDIRRIESIKQGNDVVGSRVRVKVVKNKVAPPFRQCEFDIMFNEGISKEGGLIDLGLEMGLVKKSGAWFNYGEIRLGQGRENAKEFLRQNRDVADTLENQIRSVASPEAMAVAPDGDEDDDEPPEEE